MSSHPGSTLKEAIALAEYIRDLGYMPEQVQDFYPTPSTISTVMYYTGLDPRTMQPVYVPTNPHEKAMQRALIQYRDPKNYRLVREALETAGRQDLIGYGKECLIRPAAGQRPPQEGKAGSRPSQSGSNGSRSKRGQGTRSEEKPARNQKPGSRPAGWAKPAPKKNKPARRGRT